MVVEPNKKEKKIHYGSFPNINVGENISSAISDSSINAVVIATPAHLHFEQANISLHAGKHVFIEKPMATTGKEVEKLIKLQIKRY